MLQLKYNIFFEAIWIVELKTNVEVYDAREAKM